MECKYFCRRGVRIPILELIDTLWNVNENVPLLAPVLSELIDTLWNVNACTTREDERPHGPN